MKSSNESNWDEYYTKREYKVPTFIVNALWQNYKAMIGRHLDRSRHSLVVAELGGANSRFYQSFKKNFPVSDYHIIDNNETGLRLFPHKDDKGTFLHNVDLLQESLPDAIGADIVFSAGLIEHSGPEDTRQIIEAHFRLARANGLILMSFPTPTRIYWAFRRFLEFAGRFPPVFERPIKRVEVGPILAELGTLLETRVIWKTVLTQRVMLTRKS